MSEDLKVKVEYYANLPYTTYIEKRQDNGTYYIARVVELPDLFFTGDTPEEALAELEIVKREWIEEYIKLGNKMPEPLAIRQHSGKIVLRIPKSLHERLAIIAELEGVSLNQLMVSELSKSAARVRHKIKSKG
jgi:predicted RNase H-like HicB family nuclease